MYACEVIVQIFIQKCKLVPVNKPAKTSKSRW